MWFHDNTGEMLYLRKSVKMGEDATTVLDDMGFERYCCRRMIVAHADLIGEISKLG